MDCFVASFAEAQIGSRHSTSKLGAGSGLVQMFDVVLIERPKTEQFDPGEQKLCFALHGMACQRP